MKKKDLTNQRFGKVIAISREEKSHSGPSRWNCICDCGNKAKIFQGRLTKDGKHPVSCGCIKSSITSELFKQDIIGQRFHRLLVLSECQVRKNKQIYWTCLCDCGVIKDVSGKLLRANETKSCGCLNREVQHYSGPNNHSWNPDLTDEHRVSRRNLPELIKWRKEIYERDNYTCRICNKRGYTLNAHHLDSWHSCKERRFDIENGVTLCKNCHRDFHKIYGSKNNTAEEFIEFFLVTGNMRKVK